MARKSAAVSLVKGEYINRVFPRPLLFLHLHHPTKWTPPGECLTSVSSTSSASSSLLLLRFSRHPLLHYTRLQPPRHRHSPHRPSHSTIPSLCAISLYAPSFDALSIDHLSFRDFDLWLRRQDFNMASTGLQDGSRLQDVSTFQDGSRLQDGSRFLFWVSVLGFGWVLFLSRCWTSDVGRILWNKVRPEGGLVVGCWPLVLARTFSWSSG